MGDRGRSLAMLCSRTEAGEGGRARHKVQLYYAQGCHLCESARRVLERVRVQVPFDLEQIDIGGDPELERRYRERLPVVVIDGEEAFTYYVHPDALRRRVAG